MRPSASILRALAILTVAAAMCSSGMASGASSSTVVSATVPSATNLSTTGCAPNTPGVTDFGVVLPGSSVVTPTDCTLTFGSSNDTARLLLRQGDDLGWGMWQPSRGALDTTFDTDGVVTSSIAAAAGTDQAMDLVQQPDGKLVVAGYCDPGAGRGVDFCVARYLVSGAPDPTWDGDGIATIAVAPGAFSDNARTVLLQPDGKVVVAGYCNNGGDNCLARFTTSGAPDASFGTAGGVIFDASGTSGADFSYGAVLQPDGKILTVGDCNTAAFGPDGCVVRFNTDGTLDTTFGSGGVARVHTAGGTADDFLRGVVVLPSGAIVTGGYCDMGATGYDACIFRLTAGGAPDATWDGDGVVTTAVAPGTGTDYSFNLVVQPDGKLVSIGQCDLGGATGSDGCIQRYATNGALDPTWDGDGIATYALSPGTGTDLFRGVALQADGKVVVAGHCYPAAGNEDGCLARMTSTGALDPTFDTDGFVTMTAAGGTNQDELRNLRLLDDGRIGAAGFCAVPTKGLDFCSVRYDGAGRVEQYANATTDWDQGVSTFGICLRSVLNGAATWSANPGCPMTDGVGWNAAPTAATQVAVANANTTTAAANLRFGLRTAAAQAPGPYVAPLTIDVLAP